MRIWIDMAPATGAETVFSLHPVERQLRAIARLSPAATEVVLSGPALPEGVDLPLRRETGPTGARLARYLASGDGPVLALDGSALVDHRLIPLLAKGGGEPVCLRSGEGRERTAVLRLTPDTPPPDEAESLIEAADALVASGRVREVSFGELPGFVVNLRREVPFTLQAVPDAESRARLEKHLFWSNYKGSTDFMTKWVYPPIVWRAVRFWTRHRLHPNWLTVMSVILAVAAVPLFAAGMWVPGLVAAYVMTILDSVDGKVARLTLTDSPLGNVLDHGLDIVHPPFWYGAWAWGLGARGPGDPLFTALLLFVAFYVADRLVLKVAKARFKRGLHAVTPLDGAVRTWIARRNVNLVVFTVGLALGLGPGAFVAVTVWQGLTLAWHASRTAWLYPRARHERQIA